MATKALYRQWRPATFQDVVGQDAIVTTLQNQVAAGRIAHAYLFCGSRGTGKTTSAKIFARAVNCAAPRNGDPCGQCDACLALSGENSLDILEIDAASNNGVDEIRDLREKIKYPPQHGRYRVYIIDEVHMLSTGAFNALLKTLEEPPDHALFILATTEPQRLPATVLSRCQRYDFRRIPLSVIGERLKVIAQGEKGEVTEEALLAIARSAEGGMRDAISLLDMCLSFGGGSVDGALVREVLGASDRGFLFRFCSHLIAGDAGQAIGAIGELMAAGREPQVFARDVTEHLRSLLLAKACGAATADLLEITKEDCTQYLSQGETISRERLLTMLDLFLSAETDMKWAGQPRIALEMATVRACLPEGSLRLDDLATRLDALERKLEGGAYTAAPTAPATTAPAPAAPAEDLPWFADNEDTPPPFTPPPPPPPPPEDMPAKAPPKPTAPPAQEEDIWGKALPHIKKEPYLYAPVTQGKYSGFDGDTLTLTFRKGQEIFQNMLCQGGRTEKIEAILAQVAGRPIALHLEMEGEKKTQTHKQKTLLQSVIDTFGREHVEIVDDPSSGA